MMTQDPYNGFPTPDELNTSTHAEEYRAGLLAVTQAAHDQIIGQREHSQAELATVSEENPNLLINTIFTYDKLTGTAFRISSSHDTEAETVRVFMESATPYRGRGQEPGFYRQHSLILDYHAKDGRVDTGKGFALLGDTAKYDAKDPTALTRLADCINRSHEMSERKFKRQERRILEERVMGFTGRIAMLKSYFGARSNKVQIDFYKNHQEVIDDENQQAK